jgi:ATP/ADP translocase
LFFLACDKLMTFYATSLFNTAYPLKTDYMAFMGRYSSLVGAVAFGMMFVGAQVNQLLGWRSAALTTPGNCSIIFESLFYISS